ncbi:uncharacterized protein METZ01_LOCUS254671 [marine metagenome]|uniref:Transcription factor zinc-finger domain-containing protein n=1 Tax=marine metagenome TaxID=408172 RepID=A0A382IRJ3_9ZZZZ
MDTRIECPHCLSPNVDQFVNNDDLWHCNTCSEMWEVSDGLEFLTIKHPEPMEGVSL